MTMELSPELITAMKGYYGQDTGWEPPVGAFGGMLTALEEELRFPVLNRADRVLLPPVKYALILQRDGGACRACWSGESIELDHIFPRSAFDGFDLGIADRSDNLTVLCSGCNYRKSNFASVYRKRPGVVLDCWECLFPAPEDEWEYEAWTESKPDLPYMVYCGRCGNVGGRVPELSWVL